MNRRVLKWMAVTTMLIDHIGLILTRMNGSLTTELLVMRGIGRIAFPLFAALFVVSLQKTSNHQRFFFRLLFLAVVSELPYNLMLTGRWIAPGLNIIWVFVLMAGADWLLEVYGQTLQDRFPDWLVLISLFAGLFLTAHLLQIDYGSFGVLVILLLSVNIRFGDGTVPPEAWRVFFLVASFYSHYRSSWILAIGGVVGAILATLPGKEEDVKLNWVENTIFRWFYPVHMLLLVIMLEVI